MSWREITLSMDTFCAWTPGSFRFRIFGYGLLLRDSRRYRVFFSVRNKLVWVLWLGHWFVTALTPGHP